MVLVLPLLAAGAAFWAGPAAAQQILKADNNDPASQGSSWVGGVVPESGTNVIAVWDNTVTGAFPRGVCVDGRDV